MWGSNSELSRKSARRDVEDRCWKEQQEEWKRQDQEREERERQREEHRRLEESVMQCAVSLRGHFRTSARRDVEDRLWKEQQEEWKRQDQEREERKRQRGEQRRLEESVMQYAIGLHGHFGTSARRDVEDRLWKEQQEEWQRQDQEREERKRQREEQRRLEESLMQYAVALREQASRCRRHIRSSSHP
ncbi:U1 [Hyposoter didymator ichnovirus]|nr:U1 [Hyposoter didymator ichnovirus]